MGIPDEKTKLFFTFLKKLESLTDRLVVSEDNDEDKKKFALCLAELYFRASHVTGLIKAIADTDLKPSEQTMDTLLTDLVDLQIELYDEVADWMKELKEPLQRMMDAVPDDGK
jgi:hypothetical protein